MIVAPRSFAISRPAMPPTLMRMSLSMRVNDNWTNYSEHNGVNRKASALLALVKMNEWSSPCRAAMCLNVRKNVVKPTGQATTNALLVSMGCRVGDFIRLVPG